MVLCRTTKVELFNSCLSTATTSSSSKKNMFNEKRSGFDDSCRVHAGAEHVFRTSEGRGNKIECNLVIVEPLRYRRMNVVAQQIQTDMLSEDDCFPINDHLIRLFGRFCEVWFGGTRVGFYPCPGTVTFCLALVRRNSMDAFSHRATSRKVLLVVSQSIDSFVESTLDVFLTCLLHTGVLLVPPQKGDLFIWGGGYGTLY